MPDLLDASVASETLMVLAELSVKGTVLLAVACLIALLLRRAPAADRHAIWFAALAGIVLLPVATVLLPDWNAVDLPGWIPATEQVPAGVAEVTGSTEPPPAGTTLANTVPLTASPHGPDAARAADETAPVPASRTTKNATDLPAESASNPVVRWLGQILSGAGSLQPSVLLFLAWISGAGLILANLVLGAMQLIRITARSRPVRGTEWTDLADEIGDRLFLRREVLILRSSSTKMPMTWGGLRPVVLLPSGADSWSAERKRCVLTHEFAHIRRWDTTTQGIAQLACAVFWFNPLVWYAASRLRSERERACDETVVELGTRPSAYADHLLDLARTVERAVLHPLGAVAMAKPTQLEGRVLSILRNRPRTLSVGRTVRIVYMIAAVAVFIPLAALSPASSPEPPTGALSSSEAEVLERAAPVPEVAPESVASGIGKRTVRRQETGIRSESVRHAPADTVDARRERLAAVFIEALGDEDPEIRGNAARMLGDLKIDSAVDALGITVTTDPVEQIRSRAAWALGEIGNERAVDRLVQAWRDASTTDLKQRIIRALTEIGTPDAVSVFREAIRDESADVRSMAVRGLAELDDPSAVAALAEATRDVSGDVRRGAVWGLGELDHPDGYDALIAALDDPDEEVRSMAAWSLGELEDERAVDALTALMQDESREIRRRVLWALQEIESPRSLDTFIEATRDEDAEVRHHAVLGLSELEDPRSVDRLIELLEDANENVRSMAARTLGDIGDDRAIGPLAALIQDQSLNVRRAAIHALSEFETEASRDALISALKADDRDVRLAAVAALHEFEDADTVRALESVLVGDADAEVRARAARTLMLIESDEALDALDRALEAGGGVRDAVMQVLGRR